MKMLNFIEEAYITNSGLQEGPQLWEIDLNSQVLFKWYEENHVPPFQALFYNDRNEKFHLVH